MKRILFISIATIVIIMTGSLDFPLRTAYAADNLVDINVSPSGGGRRRHHKKQEEKTEKEREIEISRANIEAQEEELKLMTVELGQTPAVQNGQTLSVQESAAPKAVKQSKKSNGSGTGASKESEEPKTSGSDLPIVPVALMIFFTDMLIVAVESAGDFDDYIRRDHVEKLVDKYKKGKGWTRISAKLEISLCMFYSRWKVKADRNLKRRREKCSAA